MAKPKPLVSPGAILVLLILVAFSALVRIFLVPPDTFIYGPDGKWLQDPQNPAKALNIQQLGRTASWSKGQWLDDKNQPVKLGPPPPPGWQQDENALEKVSNPDGKKAVWYAKNEEWLDDSGKLIWQVPTHSR